MTECSVCGTEQPAGAVRCDGELPDGSRCGNDLVDETGGQDTRVFSRRGR